MIAQNRLIEKAARYEIDAHGVAQKLDDYAAYLVEYNEKVNLTAITDPEGIEDRHFIDSLLLADCPEVGSGVRWGGFGRGLPSVVSKRYRPHSDRTRRDLAGTRVESL